MKLHPVIEGERWGREKNRSTKLEKDEERGEKSERERRTEKNHV